MAINCTQLVENFTERLNNCATSTNCTIRQNCPQFRQVFNQTLSDKCKMTDYFSGETSAQGVTTQVLLVSAVILFIFLILKDGLKGLKIRAHWIPGDFLVLSALTIELLNLISTQGAPMNWKNRAITLNEFWMIHTSRILLCVVIAYLMPAMANPGAEDFWGKIESLALTVFLHVISELYFINPKSAGSILKGLWPKQRGTNITLYYIFAALIFSSFVLLLLLLGCANIAGRGIERIIAEKTPLILMKGKAEKDDHHQQLPSDEGLRRAEEDHGYNFWCRDCWKRIEDAVLRAWIVARAYSLEYVIARSPLASSATIIVTFQIAITIVAGVRNSPKMAICDAHDKFMFSITMLQCAFILIGWSMIGWRWATAVAYYGRWWSSCFPIEDFWTRHLKDLQEKKTNELQQSQLLHAKIEKLVANQSTKVTLHKILLYGVIGLQWFTVSFSKACLRGSRILFSNKLTDAILTKLKKDYSPVYESILEGVQMLGENPESLWLSNRQSIPKAVSLAIRGNDNGGTCEHLVHFLAYKRTSRRLGLRCLEPNKPQTEFKYLCMTNPIEGTQQLKKEPFSDTGTKSAEASVQETGLKYLCKTRPIEGDEQFTDTSRKAWKMTAVSLLSIIVQLSPNEKEQPSTSGSLPPSIMKDCLDAYSQAWEIIDFVDNADTEADGITSEAADEITSEAADKYFGILRKKANSSEATPPYNVTAALTALKKECKSKTETPVSKKAFVLKGKVKTETQDKTQGCTNRWTGGDSTDWKAAAWGSAVYNLCNSIQYNGQTDVNDLLKELESSLADIIYECLQKTQLLLMPNCRKWAVKNDERKIAKALYTAGKARIIVEMLRDKIVMEERSDSAVVPYPE